MNIYLTELKKKKEVGTMNLVNIFNRVKSLDISGNEFKG